MYKLTECLKANQILRIKHFPSKLEILTKLNKIDSQNSQNKLFGISAFGYENKNVSTVCVKKHFRRPYWSMINRRRERQKALCSIKDFNAFMYNHTLHRGRKHFCRYCLQAFSTEEIFKINGI